MRHERKLTRLKTKSIISLHYILDKINKEVFFVKYYILFFLLKKSNMELNFSSIWEIESLTLCLKDGVTATIDLRTSWIRCQQVIAVVAKVWIHRRARRKEAGKKSWNRDTKSFWRNRKHYKNSMHDCNSCKEGITH